MEQAAKRLTHDLASPPEAGIQSQEFQDAQADPDLLLPGTLPERRAEIRLMRPGERDLERVPLVGT